MSKLTEWAIKMPESIITPYNHESTVLYREGKIEGAKWLLEQAAEWCQEKTINFNNKAIFRGTDIASRLWKHLEQLCEEAEE